jgi:hypothetical protein
LVAAVGLPVVEASGTGGSLGGNMILSREGEAAANAKNEKEPM